MKKILWVSRHRMHGVQIGALKRMFGKDVNITSDTKPFDNAKTVVSRYQKGNYDDIIVVAPLWVIYHMTQLGLKPLWAKAEIVTDPSQADWETNGRLYRFVGFQRVADVQLILHSLGPEAMRQEGD